ncbi:DUF4307 domain-containing protein [Streptacidiphilus sp. PB12-B1b]|uniref:DUF4307 domain-containing protein n=1 Tax=Streptacidiphilus sp. PB12-B1b TaxID=2705012 RepID=UPI0015FBA9BC|nr:DUF4307 domain-containing protein [Streptacidiphilus sp. PB12-B1b]QMU75112.1 DUF4307 domain-containing protein [Streptacidiphilus sp. PB12-B1b]
MSTTTEGAARLTPPAGRYGTDLAEKDRRLRRWYQVIAGLAVVLMGVLTAVYVMHSSVSGEVEAFQVVSPSKVLIHLQVTKNAGQAGNCTVRSRDANGNEVGRITVTIPKAASTYDTIVDLRTSGLGTTGELVSCSS